MQTKQLPAPALRASLRTPIKGHARADRCAPYGTRLHVLLSWVCVVRSALTCGTHSSRSMSLATPANPWDVRKKSRTCTASSSSTTGTGGHRSSSHSRNNLCRVHTLPLPGHPGYRHRTCHLLLCSGSYPCRMRRNCQNTKPRVQP